MARNQRAKESSNQRQRPFNRAFLVAGAAAAADGDFKLPRVMAA